MRPAARHKTSEAWLQVGDGARLEIHHTPWWRHIYRDFRRYRVTADPALRTVFLTQGFWASSAYRLSRAALLRTRLARPLVALVQKLLEVVTGISLPPPCEIGHNCSLAQNVTIGVAGSGDNRGAPVIGNRVFIGAHAIIVGRLTVGDDAVICAGSVVSRSVPARAVVMGNPARVVSYDGSFDYVFYDGMDVDPARRLSLERSRSLNAGSA